MEIKFKILGKPRGKQRPRMCVSFGKQVTYTPKQTSGYEKLVKAAQFTPKNVKNAGDFDSIGELVK